MEVAPGTYHVTPLRLRSRVDLHLDAGATLVFSRRIDDDPLAWVDDGSGPEAGCRSPIWGEGLTGVSITGEGVIDGQGDAWRPVKQDKLTPEAWQALTRSGGVVDAKAGEWYPAVVARDGRKGLEQLAAARPPAPLEAYAPYRPLLRPNLVRLVDCTGVTLSGVTFRNSPGWNVHLELCDDVNVRGVTIFNVVWAQNGDGIDIDSCRNVTMEDSTVNAGDDGICLKSGKDEAGRRRGRPTENVTITHCTVGTGHGGVVIGSEMSGSVRHVVVRDCTFDGTGNGLRFKSVRGRGGVVSDVDVSGVTMSNIGGVAILFDLYYFLKQDRQGSQVPPVTEATPAFRDFRIRNVRCAGAGQALQIRGLPEMPLRNVELDDADLTADKAGFVADTNGVTFRNVRVHAREGSVVQITNSPGLTLAGCSGFAQ